MQNQKILLKINSAKDYGDVVALHSLFDLLDLRGIINKHITKKNGVDVGSLTEIMVVNRNIDPKSKRQIPDWYKDTELPSLLGIPKDKITNELLCRALDYLDEKTQRKILNDLVKELALRFNIPLNSFLYDITSSYVEGEECPLAKHGYSRDRRPDKKQVNIDLAVTKDPVFPVFSSTFEGNVPDVKRIEKSAILFREDYPQTPCTLIIDKGPVSDDNLKKLIFDLDYELITSLRLTSKIKDLILDIPEEEFSLLDLEKKEEGLFAVEREMILQKGKKEKKLKLVVFFSEKKRDQDRKQRTKEMRKAQEEIAKLRKNLNKGVYRERDKVVIKVNEILKTRQVLSFFKPQVKEIKEKVKNKGEEEKKKITLRIKVNKEALKRQEALDGKYVLATTHLEYSKEEVLSEYREKKNIENSFKVIKGPIKIRPIRHWKENRVGAHIFICVLAFFLRCLLEYLLKREKIKISSSKALSLLGKVKMVEGNLILGELPQKFKQLTELSKEQKLLFKTLKIDLPPPKEISGNFSNFSNSQTSLK